jgi:hypothetical protein
VGASSELIELNAPVVESCGVLPQAADFVSLVVRETMVVRRLLLAVLFACSLAGCGRQTESAPSVDSSTAELRSDDAAADTTVSAAER